MERKESKGTIMTKTDGRKPIEYEYRPGDELVLRFRRPVIDLIPCEARDHLMAAQKEVVQFLLAGNPRNRPQEIPQGRAELAQLRHLWADGAARCGRVGVESVEGEIGLVDL